MDNNYQLVKTTIFFVTEFILMNLKNISIECRCCYFFVGSFIFLMVLHILFLRIYHFNPKHNGQYQFFVHCAGQSWEQPTLGLHQPRVRHSCYSNLRLSWSQRRWLHSTMSFLDAVRPFLPAKVSWRQDPPFLWREMFAAMQQRAHVHETVWTTLWKLWD